MRDALTSLKRWRREGEGTSYDLNVFSSFESYPASTAIGVPEFAVPDPQIEIEAAVAL